MKAIWLYVKQYIWKFWFVNFIGSLTVLTIIVSFTLSLMYAYAPPNSKTITINFEELDLLHPITFLYILLFLLLISFQSAGLYATIAEVFATGRVRFRTYLTKGTTYTLKLLSTYVLMWVPSVSAFALGFLVIKIHKLPYLEVGGIVFIFLFFVAFFSPLLFFFMCIHAPLLIIIEQQKPLQSLLSSARISLLRQNRTDAIVTAALSIFATLFAGVFSSILIIPLIRISSSLFVPIETFFWINIIWLIGFAVILSLCLVTFGLIIINRYTTSFRQQFLATIELTKSKKN